MRYASPRRFSDAGRAAIRAREDRKRERLLAIGFWDRVDRSAGLFACWPWTGTRQTNRRLERVGYGYFTIEGKTVYAHRRALEVTLGRALRHGEEAMHSCDNPPCCNPSHLRPGTHAENIADMVAKGRSSKPNARLTVVQVREVRRRLAQGESQRLVGIAFGVARSTIGSIAQGLRWQGIA